MHYYEMHDPQTGSYEHVCAESTVAFDEHLRLLYAAKRVWLERDNGHVEYVKLRSPWISDMSQVDLKEFAWVKLQSQEHTRT